MYIQPEPKGKTMPDNIDLTQAMADAEARRQAVANAEEEARKSQRNELVGDLLLDVQATANDTTLDHDAKMSRLQAARSGINGQGSSVPAPSAPAADPAVPFDYASLSEEARRIVDMVAADPDRFKVEEWGAVKDKSYTKLRKDHQAAQAPGDGSSAAPAPAAKKTGASAPAAEPASDDSGDEPKSDEQAKSGGSAWSRIKNAAKEAAQNAKQ